MYSRYVSGFKTQQLNLSDKRVKEYWSWCDYHFKPMFSKILPEDSILDIGCGPGYFMKYLENLGYKNLHGIDVSPEQCEIAKSLNLQVFCNDVFEFLTGKENNYSAIIAIDFIEHFTKNEILKLLPLISKALKKDGIFVIQTPNGQGLFPGQVIYGDLTHFTIFAEDSLRQFLRLTGFTDIKIKESGPAPNSLEGRMRHFLWDIIRAFIRIVRQIEAKNSSRLYTENIICWCKKE
ncbi:MAG: hypothetical protein A2X63_04930 [Ignavibacteria bacterium GWA2_35_8]|nr:MAG: hypothetical protein A2X63_04930 [Ignavibacteria bacterium GWA2_35_8]